MKLAEFWSGLSRSRWLMPVIILLAVGLIITANSTGSDSVETDPERVQRLRENFACPECDGQSIAESNAAVAATISRVIESEVAAGSTDTQIRNLLLDDWGQEILLNPTSEGIGFWVWFFPTLTILIAAALLGAWLFLLSKEWKAKNNARIVVAGFIVVMLGGAAYGLTIFSGERGVNDALTGSIDRTPGQRISECQDLASGGDVQGGIVCLDELLDLDPENSAILANKGWLFALTGRSAEDPEQVEALNSFAFENLNRALELRPTNRDALAWRTVLNFWEDDLVESCQDLVELYQLSPSPDIVGLTAGIAEQCGV